MPSFCGTFTGWFCPRAAARLAPPTSLCRAAKHVGGCSGCPSVVVPLTGALVVCTDVDAYLVVEHQPQSCSQYPASGSIVWTDISVMWENGDVRTSQAVPGSATALNWKAHTYQDMCNTKGEVLPNGNVEFTWST